MAKKARVKIALEKAGFDTKVIVTSLQRTTTKPEDEIWVRNLEVTAENIEFELDDKVAEQLAKDALMDMLADAAVAKDVGQGGRQMNP